MQNEEYRDGSDPKPRSYARKRGEAMSASLARPAHRSRGKPTCSFSVISYDPTAGAMAVLGLLRWKR